MSVQVRRRRESAAFLATYIGAQAELLVDTTNNRVQVHDGVTPGGFPAAKLGEVITNVRTAVADANYVALVGDRTIAITSLSTPRTITLAPAAAYPTGTRLTIVDETGLCSLAMPIVVLAAGTDTINGQSSQVLSRPYAVLAVTSDGVSRWTVVDQAAVTSVAMVRQTVLSGPVSAGLPALFPVTAPSLTLSTQGITTSTPLIATAALGFGGAGSSDLVLALTSNLIFSVTASSINYLYLDLRAGTAGVTVLPPIYQFGGVPSVINRQFTFDTQAMIGYLGNGTTAVPTPLLFLGEAVASASAVTSAVTYAYNGLFDSGALGGLPAAGAALTRAHNLGVADTQATLTVKCVAAEGGYAAGQTMSGLLANTGTSVASVPLALTRLSVSMIGGSAAAPFSALNLSTGALFNPTPANWAPRLVVRRGWGGA